MPVIRITDRHRSIYVEVITSGLSGRGTAALVSVVCAEQMNVGEANVNFVEHFIEAEAIRLKYG